MEAPNPVVGNMWSIVKNRLGGLWKQQARLSLHPLTMYQDDGLAAAGGGISDPVAIPHPRVRIVPRFAARTHFPHIALCPSAATGRRLDSVVIFCARHQSGRAQGVSDALGRETEWRVSPQSSLMEGDQSPPFVREGACVHVLEYLSCSR